MIDQEHIERLLVLEQVLRDHVSDDLERWEGDSYAVTVAAMDVDAIVSPFFRQLHSRLAERIGDRATILLKEREWINTVNLYWDITVHRSNIVDDEHYDGGLSIEFCISSYEIGNLSFSFEVDDPYQHDRFPLESQVTLLFDIDTARRTASDMLAAINADAVIEAADAWLSWSASDSPRAPNPIACRFHQETP